MTQKPISRRRLLACLSPLPFVSILGSCGRDAPKRSDAKTPDPEPVLVVGGGLTGLVALDVLVSAGVAAELIEAAPRLGGRIYTLRDGLAPGLRAEAGAERVFATHEHLIGLMNSLEVETVEYPTPKDPFILEWGGSRYPYLRPEDLPKEICAGLSSVEREAFPLSIQWTLAHRAAQVPLGDPRSALQLLRDQGLTKTGEAFVRAFCPVPLDRVSAGSFQRMARHEFSASATGRCIAGGTDQIINALAQRHEGSIHTGVRVVHIAQDESKVLVKDATGRTFEASKAIVCLPLQPLRRLDFQGGMPDPLAKRLDLLLEEAEIKVHFQVPSTPFKNQRAARYTMRPQFPRVTWVLPETSTEGDFVLNAMAVHQDLPLVREAAAGGNRGLSALVASCMPELEKDVRALLCHDFSADPLAGGAYAFSKDGSSPSESFVRAGRLLFAGSDLSEQPGWMEGAVRSAEAAALEVLT